MRLPLRLALIAFSVLFLIAVLHLVRKGRLQVKYSLLWLFSALVLFICAVFPHIVTVFSSILGILTPSNFVFLVGLSLLILICLSLTVIVSWQSRDIRALVQEIALLKHDLAQASQQEDKTRSAS
jgi:hypothetical protein